MSYEEKSFITLALEADPMKAFKKKILTVCKLDRFISVYYFSVS
jgi:hypothetical protein